MGDCSTLTGGSGSGVRLISKHRLELLLLRVCRIEGPGVTVKFAATFGDIGDGVESPSCMTTVGGVVVCHGHCSGGGQGLFSRLYSNCLPLPLLVDGVVIVRFHANRMRWSCLWGVEVLSML